MTTGQWRNLVLLLVLLGMELLRNQGLQNFLKNVLVNPIQQTTGGS